ncbi:hypothetical protein NDU88_001746 [Pleurodeles waltl]|uniref:Uncharacterized protein n=1 Tax=Pleurodeles waltl TaxID=8319 RepID=A0AAV7LDI5_PLEWA|nr:hypothetical protein NDU88_001746 [Pleurodeles waltl]
MWHARPPVDVHHLHTACPMKCWFTADALRLTDIAAGRDTPPAAPTRDAGCEVPTSFLVASLLDPGTGIQRKAVGFGVLCQLHPVENK